MNAKEIKRRTKLAEDVFHEVFKSLQLITYYVLYYDMDFSKQQVKNFNKFLKQHNEEMRLYEKDKLMEIDQNFKDNLGIDCWKKAVSFPHRPKMKLYPKPTKMKYNSIVLNNAIYCIEDYLILSIYILRKHYKFSGDKIREWWEHVIEFSRLYTEGLTDEHVIKYFIQECNLEIT